MVQPLSLSRCLCRDPRSETHLLSRMHRAQAVRASSLRNHRSRLSLRPRSSPAPRQTQPRQQVCSSRGLRTKRTARQTAATPPQRTVLIRLSIVTSKTKCHTWLSFTTSPQGSCKCSRRSGPEQALRRVTALIATMRVMTSEHEL